MEDWISHQDAAAALGVTKQRVTQLCETKKLRCLRDEGGRVRAVHKGDIEARKRREAKNGPNGRWVPDGVPLRRKVMRGKTIMVSLAAAGVEPGDFVTVTREGTRYVVDTKPIKAVKTEAA